VKPKSLPVTPGESAKPREPTELAIARNASEPLATNGHASKPAVVEHDDIALIHGRTEDGQGLKILRKRQDRFEIGAVMPLVPGKPITGEVVRLTPREESPLLCNVHVEYAPETDNQRGTSAGPAQVATDRYRSNWDQIFGKKSEPQISDSESPDSDKPMLN
jgi:hypothetical protein